MVKGEGCHVEEASHEEERQHMLELEEEHAALTASIRDLMRKVLFASQKCVAVPRRARI